MKRTMTWIEIASRKDTVLRSLKVAAVVGTILVCINYGDFLLSGQFEQISWLKVLLTYCVPYGVSTYAAVAALLSGSKE